MDCAGFSVCVLGIKLHDVLSWSWLADGNIWDTETRSAAFSWSTCDSKQWQHKSDIRALNCQDQPPTWCLFYCILGFIHRQIWVRALNLLNLIPSYFLLLFLHLHGVFFFFFNLANRKEDPDTHWNRDRADGIKGTLLEARVSKQFRIRLSCGNDLETVSGSWTGTSWNARLSRQVKHGGLNEEQRGDLWTIIL